MIPKVLSPEGFDQCCNISCTNFFVQDLRIIRSAVGEAGDQTKRKSVWRRAWGWSGKFVVDMLDYINDALKDNRSAVVVTSVDFSKDFNRPR